MKRIIEEVLEAEEKVNAGLKEARRKASEILQSAEKENSEKMAEAKEESRRIIQTAVENAKKQAELIRQESLEKTDHQKETRLKSKAVEIEAVVDEICKIILSTEYNGGGE